MLLALLTLSPCLAADAPEASPTAEVVVHASAGSARHVVNVHGKVVWRPGMPSARHGNGRVAFSAHNGVCFDPEGRRQHVDACTIDLEDGTHLSLSRDERTGEVHTALSVDGLRGTTVAAAAR